MTHQFLSTKPDSSASWQPLPLLLTHTLPPSASPTPSWSAPPPPTTPQPPQNASPLSSPQPFLPQPHPPPGHPLSPTHSESLRHFHQRLQRTFFSADVSSVVRHYHQRHDALSPVHVLLSSSRTVTSAEKRLQPASDDVVDCEVET